MIYNANNWYWLVSGVAQVWSSASLTYVEFSNAAYQRWTAAGHHATKIGNATDLLHVMHTAVRPTVMQKGIILACKATSALNGPYALDETSRAAISSLALNIASGRPLPGGAETINFNDATGHPHAFTAAQFGKFADLCDNYVYQWEQALASNLHGKRTAYPATLLTLI